MTDAMQESLELRYADGLKKGDYHFWNYRIEDREGNVHYCGMTIHPEQRASEHGSCSKMQRIHCAMLDKGVGNFVMIVHDGDSDHVMRGGVKEYVPDAAAAREVGYMREFRTIVSEFPDNPYACNVASHVLARKGSHCPVTFGGFDFKSKVEAARHFGVHGEVFESWLRKGLTEPPEFNGNGIPVTWRGRRFPHVIAAAEWEEVPVSRMRRWIKMGLTDPVPHSTAIPVTWQGKEYPSAKAAGRAAGVSDHTMKAWAARGITDYPEGFKPAEEAGDSPLWVAVEWQGQRYKSARAAARAADVNTTTMLKWSRAGITNYPEGFRRTIRWNGHEFPDVAAIGRSEGVSRTTADRWLKKGLTAPPARFLERRARKEA